MRPFSVVWLATTFLTEATSPETLAAFYRLVRPPGPGWRHIRAATGVAPAGDSMPDALLGWVLGCIFVYAGLFGAGSFLFGEATLGVLWTVAFVGSGIGLARLLPRLWGRSAAEEPATEVAVPAGAGS